MDQTTLSAALDVLHHQHTGGMQYIQRCGCAEVCACVRACVRACVLVMQYIRHCGAGGSGLVHPDLEQKLCPIVAMVSS